MNNSFLDIISTHYARPVVLLARPSEPQKSENQLFFSLHHLSNRIFFFFFLIPFCWWGNLATSFYKNVDEPDSNVDLIK